MPEFRDVFPALPRVVFIVIHVVTREQALRNIGIAHDAGAHGVFLVNHNVSSEILIHTYCMAWSRYPRWWIGVNFLRLLPRNAVQMLPNCPGVSGLWLDDAGFVERAADPCEYVRRLGCWRAQSHADDVMLFGGVAFKYRDEVRNPARAAGLVAPYVDVVTTSGTQTGSVPDVMKIQGMKEAIGNRPLAIASGITPENVHRFIPHADCFLVSTGMSHSHAELDQSRICGLIRTITDSSAFLDAVKTTTLT